MVWGLMWLWPTAAAAGADCWLSRSAAAAAHWPGQWLLDAFHTVNVHILPSFQLLVSCGGSRSMQNSQTVLVSTVHLIAGVVQCARCMSYMSKSRLISRTQHGACILLMPCSMKPAMAIAIRGFWEVCQPGFGAECNLYDSLLTCQMRRCNGTEHVSNLHAIWGSSNACLFVCSMHALTLCYRCS